MEFERSDIRGVTFEYLSRIEAMGDLGLEVKVSKSAEELDKAHCQVIAADVKLGTWEHPEQGLQKTVTTVVLGKGLVKLQQLWSEHTNERESELMHSYSIR